MTFHSRHRGAAPVGYVSDLDAVEAGAVLYFRLWNDGAEGQSRAATDFAHALGARHGAGALNALEQICGLCTRHGRRPLLRHDVTCQCLGADEACLAHMVGSATTGEREDAMLIATLMVRADMAPGLAGLAETLGLALHRMSLTTAPAQVRTSSIRMH